MIVDPDGRMLTEKAPGEAPPTATIDLARARDKAFGERNDVLGDRRPELYSRAAAVVASEHGDTARLAWLPPRSRTRSAHSNE